MIIIAKKVDNFVKHRTNLSNSRLHGANNKIAYGDKTKNKLSDNISKDLQKRGMKFVGSVIIYSYLQAIGVIYSHDKGCYLYKDEQTGNL